MDARGPLVEVLLAAVDPAAVPVLAATPDLEARLAGFLAAARAAWPQIKPRDELFVAHLAARLPPGDEPRALEALHATDLYLAFACAGGDGKAIGAFEEKFGREIPAALSRMRAKAEQIDEVAQVVREKLFVAKEGVMPKIADYSGRGPLLGWLRAVIVHTAVSLQRREGLEPAVTDDGEPLLAAATTSEDPELDYIRARYAAPFKDAFHDALRGLTSQDRNILRLHLIDGLNIEQIGGIYKVHRATVARWIAASRQALVEGTRRVLCEKLSLDSAEFQSITRLCRSQVDLSLLRVLGED